MAFRWILTGFACSFAALGTAAQAQTATELAQLSIEQLGDVQVTSVSRRAESIGEAPSAVYVITREEILQSGARSVPEILRLAPNLQVAQTSASRYVITARGFNGAQDAQNFSNKLLVLIDGRTVYSPLFSGVYWDMQGVLAQDIERIEVISGPGATLWGANAVNGVVNIITRSAKDTQGGLISLSAGNQERSLGLRYGGQISETASYRVYADSFQIGDSKTTGGGSMNDHWSRPQAGFRLDWTPAAADALTVQGDVYGGFEAQAGAPAEDISGQNLTARWTRTFSPNSSLQVQTYYDRAKRSAEVDGSGFRVDTYDVDVQHSFALGHRNEVVWGGGYRTIRYAIDGSASLQWSPNARNLSLYNIFLQDTVAITPTVRLVLGAKLEDDAFIDPVVLPNARLSWTPSDRVTLWTAVSKAIRSPTPFDRDVVEVLGGARFLVGDTRFRSERLTAYEIGAKMQPSARTSLSVSAYYNDYDDLRSVEPTPNVFLPLQWGNLIKGRTYGVEAWGDYQAASWWRLSASATYLDERFKSKTGASEILGLSQAANDPTRQASLKSSMTLGPQVVVDAALRHVGALPDPRVPAYTELNARIGWNLTDKLQLSLAGRNLLHDQHLEYALGSEIPRSVVADLQWRF